VGFSWEQPIAGPCTADSPQHSPRQCSLLLQATAPGATAPVEPYSMPDNAVGPGCWGGCWTLTQAYLHAQLPCFLCPAAGIQRASSSAALVGGFRIFLGYNRGPRDRIILGYNTAPCTAAGTELPSCRHGRLACTVWALRPHLLVYGYTTHVPGLCAPGRSQ
jgi:hypothetical protein